MTDDGRNKLINESLPVYEESLPTHCHNNVIEDPMTGLRRISPHHISNFWVPVVPMGHESPLTTYYQYILEIISINDLAVENDTGSHLAARSTDSTEINLRIPVLGGLL